MSDKTETSAQGNSTTSKTAGTESTDNNFTPITSQEELNKLIKDRIGRERAKFSDYSELKAKASQLDELEEAKKTETQKLIERAEAAEAKVQAFETQAQINAWKNEVSAEFGVPADVLAGDTKEALEAHAKALAPLLNKAPNPTDGRVIITQEGATALALNSDELENKLARAVGAI